MACPSLEFLLVLYFTEDLMTSRQLQIAALSVAALLVGAPAANADSASANCQVRKGGDAKQGQSGPCTFSQRQGYINLDLRNGDSFSLTPSGKEGHYRDQKGNKVVRTITGNGTEEFKWEGGRRVLVTFTGGSGGGYTPPAGSGAAGSPVPGLQDLVGVRGRDGEVALRNRGYTWAGTDKSSADSYGYWRENENGQCVVVRTSNGRYASIAYATELDCKQAAGGGGMAERQDAFDTICGVMVGGRTYRYRCGATDFYSGNRKVRTELRYPDQTIQLTWQPGNRVGLQFEGMVPKEERYSTSEGETNWVFEDKTYFYYSDKGMAQSEWRNFRD